MADENHENDVNDWEFAKQGISLWLNNDPDNAEEHFRQRMGKINVYAGFAFTAVMNAVISYESDKIELAQSMLKDLEKRCSGIEHNGSAGGWLQTFRTKFFGSNELPNNQRRLTDILEEKIILADSLMCSAILTFLTQDIGGLMRGSWLLRKAWKLYQTTYVQIYELYKSSLIVEQINDFPNDRPTCDSSCSRILQPVTPFENLFETESNFSIPRSQTACSITKTVDNSAKVFPPPFTNKKFNNTSTRQHTVQKTSTNITNTKINLENQSNQMNSHSKQPAAHTTTQIATTSYERKNLLPSKSSLFLDLNTTKTTRTSIHKKNGFIRQVPFSCPEPRQEPSVPTPIITNRNSNVNLRDIDAEVIKRLMGAISFGYGIFQLSVSLLPANLLKLISFLGFEGNRIVGISSLMYAKSTMDMRAPLATLALLWYYTIGAQLFHLNESDTQAEIAISKQILKDSQKNYATSAIFLFFRGRLKRLQCNMNTAIDFYDAAYRMSAQRELKLLCLHEVGWCRLVQLDFGNAMLHFHELRLASTFSKSFYTYLTTICQGAFGRFDNLIKLRGELAEMVNRSGQKETQIDKFIKRRLHKLPSSENERNMFHVDYWKFFVYEMLFLWNTIPSCGPEILHVIISDCTQSPDSDQPINEPSMGLANLIKGTCKLYLRNLPQAIIAFRQCIEQRMLVNEDVHISAFAYYELAVLLLKESPEIEERKQEARAMLEYAQNFFKNYDFESRLCPRIHSALKNML